MEEVRSFLEVFMVFLEFLKSFLEPQLHFPQKFYFSRPNVLGFCVSKDVKQLPLFQRFLAFFFRKSAEIQRFLDLYYVTSEESGASSEVFGAFFGCFWSIYIDMLTPARYNKRTFDRGRDLSTNEKGKRRRNKDTGIGLFPK